MRSDSQTAMSPSPHSTSRAISLLATAGSTLTNAAIAFRILTASRSLHWDWSGWSTHSDLESFPGPANADAAHLLWGVLALSYAAAATAGAIGFLGVIRNKLRYVRFYRDYTVADLFFTAVSAIGLALLACGSSESAFSLAALRAGVCEELGRQPELLRDVASAGLDLETCEFWFERAAVVALAVLLVLVVVKLHFVVALSHYCAQLKRAQSPHSYEMRRIYLLPSPPASPVAAEKSDAFRDDVEARAADEEIVYAAVPVGRVSADEARRRGAREAWVTNEQSQSKQHRHARRNSHGHAHKHHRAHTHSHRRSKTFDAPYRDDPADEESGGSSHV